MAIDTFTLDVRRSESGRGGTSPQLDLVWYEVRCDGGRAHPVRLDWREGWLADLRHLSNRDHGGAVLGRLGERIAQLLAPTEWPALLRRMQDARREGRQVRLNILCGATELLWLPWEALPVGTSSSLSALVGGPIRYAWPGSGTRPGAPGPHPDGGRLLLVCAGDEGFCGGIHRALRAALGQPGPPRFCDPDRDVLHRPSLAQLVEVLEARERSGRPVTMLHLAAPLAGTATHPLVLLEGAAGAQRAVPLGALRDSLARFAASLRVVLLTPTAGAHPPGAAGRVAQELHRTGIQLVVAPRIALTAPAAQRVSEVLHRALLRRTLPVEAAVHTARADLERQGHLVDAAAIQVLVRPDSPLWTRPFAQRPHKGLAPYGIEDAPFFVGRTTETDAVLRDLDNLRRSGSPRLYAIVGVPGIGKSSLALAGVAAGLQRRRSERWQVAVIHPGLRPQTALTSALANRDQDDHQLLIVVDGLEQLLEKEVPESEAHAFANQLWRLAVSGTSGVTVLATLRIAALGACSRITIEDRGKNLNAVLYEDGHRCFLNEPGPRMLRHIVEEPVRAVGLAFEDGLVNSIVSQASLPGASLGALSTSLDLLWSQRTGTTLQRSSLEAFGGLTGATASAAEQVWQGIAEDDRPLAEGLLRSLVRGRGAEARARPVQIAGLRPPSGAARAQFDRVVAALTERGLVRHHSSGADALLLLGTDRVLQEWPRLRDWLRPHAAAAPAPSDATSTAPSRPARPPRSPRSRRVAWALSALLLGVAGLAAHDWWQTRTLQQAAAERRFTAARDLLSDPTAATVLLRQIPPALLPAGWREAANAALQAPQAHELRHHDAPVKVIDFAPSGARLLTVADGIAQLGRPGATWRPLRSATARAATLSAAFTPSGDHAVTVSARGEVQRWPVEGGDPVALVEGGTEDTALASFSPEGAHLLLARRSGWELVSTDRGAVTKGTVPLTRDGRAQNPVALAVSDDGSRWAIATDAGRVIVWDMGQKRPQVHRHEGVKKLAINPAGTHLLVTGAGGMRIIDLVRGVGSSRTPPSVEVSAAAFGVDGGAIVVDYLDRDGQTRHLRRVDLVQRRNQIESPPLEAPATALAAWGGRLIFRGEADGSVRQLDPETGAPVRRFQGHSSKISRLAISPEGHWLASTSLDGELRLWKLDGQGPPLVQRLDDGLSDENGVVISQDAAWVAARGPDGAVRIWPAAAPEQATMLGAAPAELKRLWVADGGDRVAARSGDGRLMVWGRPAAPPPRPLPATPDADRPEAPAPAAPSLAPEAFVRTVGGTVVAVDSDLRHAAVRGPRADLRLLTLDTAESAPLELPEVVGARQARFDATGSLVAVGDGQGTVELRDAHSGALQRRTPMVKGPVEALCVAPGGAALGAGSTAGGLQLWTAESGAAQPLAGLSQRVRDCAFSGGTGPEGRLLVQLDGEAQVWLLGPDGPTLELQVATAAPAQGRVAAFADPTTLATVDRDGALRRWLLSTDALHRGLWAATDTCTLPGEEPLDLARWCACETCLGRSPATCAGLDTRTVSSTLDSLEAWCPG